MAKRVARQVPVDKTLNLNDDLVSLLDGVAFQLGVQHGDFSGIAIVFDQSIGFSQDPESCSLARLKGDRLDVIAFSVPEIVSRKF